MIGTAVVVRNTGELLVPTKLSELLQNQFQLAQKLILGRIRKAREYKLLLQSLALTRREGRRCHLERGSLIQWVLGAARGMNTVCVRNATMCFIINIIQPLQNAQGALG